MTEPPAEPRRRTRFDHTESLLRPSRLCDRVIPLRRLLPRVTAFVAVLVTAVVAAASASAAPPCAIALLADWLDNSRIDHVYALPCYEAAIDAIPQDLEDYTNAADVIARAFQQVAGRRLERGLEGPVPPGSTPPAVTPPVDSSSSTAVPIPIIALGGMSLALLAAGGVGYVSRRRRETRGQP